MTTMDKRLFKMEEVAEMLGLSRSKVYQLTNRGKLASVTIDRSRRVPDWAVDQFLNDLQEQQRENK
jgi:excisionase family DNA binding protein